MSFLRSQPTADPLYQPNSAATGLGHLINVDPSRIGQIANSIGQGANGIATAGGAPAGYDGSAAPVAMSNHLQWLDPGMLQRLQSMFSGGAGTGFGGGSWFGGGGGGNPKAGGMGNRP